MAGARAESVCVAFTYRACMQFCVDTVTYILYAYTVLHVSHCTWLNVRTECLLLYSACLVTVLPKGGQRCRPVLALESGGDVDFGFLSGVSEG